MCGGEAVGLVRENMLSFCVSVLYDIHYAHLRDFNAFSYGYGHYSLSPYIHEVSLSPYIYEVMPMYLRIYTYPPIK